MQWIHVYVWGSSSLGHGFKKVSDKHNKDMRVVSIIGDSTFFHSGMTSL